MNGKHLPKIWRNPLNLYVSGKRLVAAIRGLSPHPTRSNPGIIKSMVKDYAKHGIRSQPRDKTPDTYNVINRFKRCIVKRRSTAKTVDIRCLDNFDNIDESKVAMLR